MVQNIREAFIENLENVTWMDTKTKQAAKEKVRRMRTRQERIRRVQVLRSIQKFYFVSRHSGTQNSISEGTGV